MLPNTYLFFLRCLLLSVFVRRKEKMVIYDLFNKFTYRYSRDQETLFVNIFRNYKKATRLLFTSKKMELVKGRELFVYEGTVDFMDSITYYIEANVGRKFNFVIRSTLVNCIPKWYRLICFLYLNLIFLYIAIGCLFSSQRAKRSIILLELTENLLIAWYLKKNACKELIVIMAYEKDITFLCHFLQTRLKIKTTLVPSSNPIRFFYKNVISDKVVFTTPYQLKEYEDLKHNWIVEETDLWPPLNFQEIEINREGFKERRNKAIGFMSSASALRAHLKFTNQTGDDDWKAEYELIDCLKNILMTEKDLSVIIYLHPLEKKNDENLAFAENYYSTKFGSKVEFAPLDKPSKSLLHLAEVSVSGFSSSQIERLYGGYKTLFAPMGYLENYFTDERLKGISANSEQELLTLLKNAFSISSDQFFEKYSLLPYRWDNYKLKSAS